MKKALLLLLIGFMALAPMTASASVRTEGMGVLPQQVEDLDLIWLFPQKIDEYSLVDYRMEYLGSTDEWGGIIHKDAYIGNWGLYVGRPFNGAPGIDPQDNAYIATLFGSIVEGMGTWEQRLAGYWGAPGAMQTWPANFFEDPENKLDLFKSFAVGNGVLGIRINYASQNNEGDTTQSFNYTSTTPDMAGDEEISENGTSVIGVNLGYGLKDLGPFNALDLGLAYYMGSVDILDEDYNWNGTTNTNVLEETETLEDDGISEIAFNARAVKEVSENTNLVSNLGFRTSKLAVAFARQEDGDLDGVQGENAGDIESRTAEHNNSLISLGVACDHKVNGGTGLVVGGLNFQYAKGDWTSANLQNAANSAVADRKVDIANDSDEFEMSYMGVWANVGVEANLKSWLQVRGGFSRELLGTFSFEGTDVSNLLNNAYQDTETEEGSFDMTEDTVMTFGIGVSHKNWNVDLLVAKYGVENFLSDADFGEGLLYSGQVLDGIAKAQIKYNF